MKLTIATRESPLALWQANHVRSELLKHFPEMEIELLGMTTKGDQLLSSPLSKIGGKGLFIKELEVAMLEGRADIAVHSMKDVPMASQLPEGMSVPVILKREDPRDALVSINYQSLDDLPEGAIVGSCSLRRRAQLLAHRPDLQIKDLRGNVNTRLQKLENGEYDAIILAAAGLIRLGFEEKITQLLPDTISLPAVGQGAIGIECVTDNSAVQEIIAKLNDPETATCVTAERAFNAKLNGGCQAPIAGFAQLSDKGLFLRGLVGDLDNGTIIYHELWGKPEEAAALGEALADNLLSRGAKEILEKIYG
ncbi:hydroxymethylbilane synthase [Ignatzschineria cameli]|uniref:Porphobilinogen deaminase n=1 Tax=Ignatzschineria cameli TaxID=2182793 RepID=A0A2U2ARP6_9GAMM|nr:hydroxymethylbilane synthase [Ignatzschineria cameli]PWD86859.1 hydroxymethylbilane synthase [Ignatzschineria cameli]PWD91833.1 hydroxymethylbilane synthase [Ignatzschineria cameli]PWD93581.1 hydroxymethylbilane synthase [Ignatzschineria cameli]PWD94323.1 hydroxymethylbilane synthase [Ignatzschineria cameli]